VDHNITRSLTTSWDEPIQLRYGNNAKSIQGRLREDELHSHPLKRIQLATQGLSIHHVFVSGPECIQVLEPNHDSSTLVANKYNT
jgi:hypothetical protein